MENWTADLVLRHHGVKGQQWGVRNGPPYPIEDKILRKGTKINYRNKDEGLKYDV